MMEMSAEISEISAVLSIAALPCLEAYHMVMPSRIEEPLDLLKIKRREPVRHAGAVYRFFRNMLFEPATIKEMVEAIRRYSDRIDIEKILESIDILREHHKKVFLLQLNIERAYKTFGDELLLSTILLHADVTEAILSKIDEKVVKYAAENAKRLIEKLCEDEGLLKTVLMILFEPFLAYSALVALRKKDYRYILRYEREVLETARIIFSFRPDIARALVSTT